MKLSILIAKLQTLQDRLGDVDVYGLSRLKNGNPTVASVGWVGISAVNTVTIGMDTMKDAHTYKPNGEVPYVSK